MHAGAQDYTFRWHGWDAKEVCVAGNFNEWQQRSLQWNGDGWSTDLNLHYGRYQFKFIIDGRWMCDQRWPVTWDESGNQNNFFDHGY